MKTTVYPTETYGRVLVNVFDGDRDHRKYTLCVRGDVYECVGPSVAIVRLIETAEKKHRGIKRQMAECERRGLVIGR